MGEGLGGQPAAGGQGESAFAHGGGDIAVVIMAGDNGDGGVVLGGGAHHGGAADVDLLDAGVEGGAGGDGIGEGVEIDDDQVDGSHAQGLELVEMVGLTAISEDTGMDCRMEGLDSALKALGETGDLLHRGDDQACGSDGGGRGAGGDDLDAGIGQGLSQGDEAGLVIDGDEGATHGNAVRADEALGGDVGGGYCLGGGPAGGLARLRGRRGHDAPGAACGHGTPRRATSRAWTASATPRWCPTLASCGRLHLIGILSGGLDMRPAPGCEPESCLRVVFRVQKSASDPYLTHPSVPSTAPSSPAELGAPPGKPHGGSPDRQGRRRLRTTERPSVDRLTRGVAVGESIDRPACFLAGGSRYRIQSQA